MAFNKELADRAIKAIEANPQAWTQGTWRCKTGMCFAGWVAQMAGAVWVTNSSESEDYLNVKTPDERVMAVNKFALEQLGVYSPTGLFLGGNTLPMIKQFIDFHDDRGF